MGPLTSSSVTTDPSLLLKLVKASCRMFGKTVTGSHVFGPEKLLLLIVFNIYLLYQCHSQLVHQK